MKIDGANGDIRGQHKLSDFKKHEWKTFKIWSIQIAPRFQHSRNWPASPHARRRKLCASALPWPIPTTLTLLPPQTEVPHLFLRTFDPPPPVGGRRIPSFLRLVWSVRAKSSGLSYPRKREKNRKRFRLFPLGNRSKGIASRWVGAFVVFSGRDTARYWRVIAVVWSSMSPFDSCGVECWSDLRRSVF